MKTVKELMEYLSTLDPNMRVLQYPRGVLEPLKDVVIRNTVEWKDRHNNNCYDFDLKKEDPNSVETLIL